MAIGQILVGIGTIIMAWLGYSYWALVFPQLIGLVVQGVLFFRASPIFPIWLSIGELKKTAIKVKSLLSNVSGFNMINYWARNADNLLIGKFHGEGALGIYNYAYKLFMLPQSILNNVLSQLILPSFKKLKEEGGDIEQEYMRLLGAISLLMMPVGFGLILFPEIIVKILFGMKWIEVKYLLPFWGVAVLTQPVMSPIGNLMVLYQAEKQLLKIGIINSIILVSFVLLGVFFSVRHVALYYVLSYLLLTIPVILYLGFYQSLNFNKNSFLKFWIGKVVLSSLILGGIWFDLKTFLYVCIAMYVVSSIWFEKSNIRILQKYIMMFLHSK